MTGKPDLQYTQWTSFVKGVDKLNPKIKHLLVEYSEIKKKGKVSRKFYNQLAKASRDKLISTQLERDITSELHASFPDIQDITRSFLIDHAMVILPHTRNVVQNGIPTNLEKNTYVSLYTFSLSTKNTSFYNIQSLYSHIQKVIKQDGQTVSTLSPNYTLFNPVYVEGDMFSGPSKLGVIDIQRIYTWFDAFSKFTKDKKKQSKQTQKELTNLDIFLYPEAVKYMDTSYWGLIWTKIPAFKSKAYKYFHKVNQYRFVFVFVKMIVCAMTIYILGNIFIIDPGALIHLFYSLIGSLITQVFNYVFVTLRGYLDIILSVLNHFGPLGSFIAFFIKILAGVGGTRFDTAGPLLIGGSQSTKTKSSHKWSGPQQKKYSGLYDYLKYTIEKYGAYQWLPYFMQFISSSVKSAIHSPLQTLQQLYHAWVNTAATIINSLTIEKTLSALFSVNAILYICQFMGLKSKDPDNPSYCELITEAVSYVMTVTSMAYLYWEILVDIQTIVRFSGRSIQHADLKELRKSSCIRMILPLMSENQPTTPLLQITDGTSLEDQTQDTYKQFIREENLRAGHRRWGDANFQGDLKDFVGKDTTKAHCWGGDTCFASYTK
jgi:hypothetical protein